jgi:hypothetical protein
MLGDGHIAVFKLGDESGGAAHRSPCFDPLDVIQPARRIAANHIYQELTGWGPDRDLGRHMRAFVGQSQYPLPGPPSP